MAGVDASGPRKKMTGSRGPSQEAGHEDAREDTAAPVKMKAEVA